ncbi:MAG: nucleotidyltransferase family protein, partial [Clostridia bacterium]|nr:nucleotidyltransferase family protein [Clostridia bacterium]
CSVPDLKTFGQHALYKFSCTNIFALQQIYDMTEGIENRLIQLARENVDCDAFVESASSKRFSVNRIKRIILNTLLDIRGEFVQKLYDMDYLPYIKVLAIKEKSNILSSVKNCKSDVVLRKQDVIMAKKDDFAKVLMYTEDRANALYSQLLDISKEQKHDFNDTSDIYQKPIFAKK